MKLAAVLNAAGKQPADLEARLLIEKATGLTPLSLVTHAERPLHAAAADLLQDYAWRRLKGEPVSRILEHSGFYGLDLYLSPDVLDPRADTETLVETALAMLREKKAANPHILDLGTGSGAILCALLDALPDAFGVGVDISPSACALAHRNLRHCRLSRRSATIRSDWTAALQGPFDLIVSNPPYIAQKEFAELDREVIDFDPHLALDGGPDGLAPYRRISVDLKRLLRPGGGACFEIGWRQAADVVEIMARAGFEHTRIVKDNARRDRVVALWG